MTSETEAAVAKELNADEVAFKDSALKKVGIIAILVVLVLGLLSTVAVVIWSTMAAGVATGGDLTPGETVSGEIGPNTSVGAAGKPYVDYRFNITSLGTYRFDLASDDGAEFDPFISVLGEGGTMLASDDDGGEGLNARLEHEFRPGEYIVRVTSYDVSIPSSPVQYHLSATAL